MFDTLKIDINISFYIIEAKIDNVTRAYMCEDDAEYIASKKAKSGDAIGGM